MKFENPNHVAQLAKFALDVLSILQHETEWGGDELDQIANIAQQCGFACLDENGFFQCTQKGKGFSVLPPSQNETDQYRIALIRLLRWATGSDKTGNPYRFNEVTEAINLLNNGKNKYDIPEK
jgi:hypothetical protein